MLRGRAARLLRWTTFHLGAAHVRGVPVGGIRHVLEGVSELRMTLLVRDDAGNTETLHRALRLSRRPSAPDP